MPVKKNHSLVCQFCGKIFHTHIKIQKCCSRECSRNSRKKRVQKTCEYCGKTFEVIKSASHQKFCDKKCRRNGLKIRVEKVCKYCGKIFEARNDQKDFKEYCNRSCRTKDKNTTKKCEWCNKEFTYLKSQGDRKCCSKKCNGKFVTDRSKKSMFVCKWCNRFFEDWTYRDTQYCSHQCLSKFAARQPKPKARRPENLITLECHTCKNPYTVHKSQKELRNSKFCSMACRGKDTAKRMKGEGNPNWAGGFNPSDYGPNWGAQSRKARKRDNYTCQVCGYYSKIRNLDVHHIKPLRLFNGDFESANKTSNLICLCRSCHKKVEHGKIRCPVPKSL